MKDKQLVKFISDWLPSVNITGFAEVQNYLFSTMCSVGVSPLSHGAKTDIKKPIRTAASRSNILNKRNPEEVTYFFVDTKLKM